MFLPTDLKGIRMAWLAVSDTYSNHIHIHTCTLIGTDYDVFQIGKTSKPKALDWGKMK